LATYWQQIKFFLLKINS